MLPVRHRLIIVIRNIRREIPPVRPVVKKLFPGGQHFVVRDRKPHVPLIIKAVQNRYLIHLLHVGSLNQRQEFPADSGIRHRLVRGQLPHLVQKIHVPSKRVLLGMFHAISVHIVVHVCKQFQTRRDFPVQFFLYDIKFLPDTLPDRQRFFVQFPEQIYQPHVKIHDAVVRIFHLIKVIIIISGPFAPIFSTA